MANSTKEAIRKASEMKFKEAILCGGSKINVSFMNANLIDNVMINIEPCLLGKGINLFSEEVFEKKLKLLKVNKLKEGIVQLHYKLLKK